MTEHSEPPPELAVTIAASPEVVWRALRDPELIRRWHGWHFEENGGLDEEVRIIYTTGVTEDEAAGALQLSDGDRFTLESTGAGTVVRVTRAPYGANPEWDAYYDDISEGWRTFLSQLRFAVERHGLAERQTVMFQGPLSQPGSLLDQLGLAAVAELAPGQSYQATVATGEELRGSVWARSARQLAVTVDSAGDGLLVLAEQPTNQHRPTGGAMLLLTTYGLSDTAFTEVRDRWLQWWSRVRADTAGAEQPTG